MRRTGSVVVWLGSIALVVRLHPGRGGLPSGGWLDWVARDPEHAITVLAAGVAWLLAAWLVVVLGLALVAEMTTGASALGRVAEGLLGRVAPAIVRHAVRSMLSAALVLSPAGPALAAATPTAVAMADAAPLPSVPAPVVAPAERIPSLDWPLTRLASPRPTNGPASTPPARVQPAPSPPPATPPSAAPTAQHRVQPGDTLWALAATELPPTATAAEITAAWQAIYAANRSVIGPDPALLLPGELLVIPAVSR
jgi:LysM repeat protein